MENSFFFAGDASWIDDVIPFQLDQEHVTNSQKPRQQGKRGEGRQAKRQARVSGMQEGGQEKGRGKRRQRKRYRKGKERDKGLGLE